MRKKLTMGHFDIGLFHNHKKASVIKFALGWNLVKKEMKISGQKKWVMLDSIAS